jgi:hypothetical protein
MKMHKEYFYRTSGQVVLEFTHTLNSTDTVAAALRDINSFARFYEHFVHEQMLEELAEPSNHDGLKLFKDSFFRKERCVSLFAPQFIHASTELLEEMFSAAVATFEDSI